MELLGGGSDINGATPSSFKNFLFSATSFAKPISLKKKILFAIPQFYLPTLNNVAISNK